MKRCVWEVKELLVSVGWKGNECGCYSVLFGGGSLQNVFWCVCEFWFKKYISFNILEFLM